MKEKHFYLYNELVALENYLSMVNNSLFQTKFKVEIKYGDSLALDQVSTTPSLNTFLETFNILQTKIF